MLFKKLSCSVTLQLRCTIIYFSQVNQSSPMFFVIYEEKKENNALHILPRSYYKTDLAASTTRNVANITSKDD